MTAQEAAFNRQTIEALQPIHPPPTTLLEQVHLLARITRSSPSSSSGPGCSSSLFGGMLAMMIRWQWAYPGQPVPVLGQALSARSGGVIGPALYSSIFTMHGLIMIFFAITPLLIGAFGNFCIPLMIGARDMAFPLLNALSFWTFVVSPGAGHRLVLRRARHRRRRVDDVPAALDQRRHARAGQTLVVAAIFVTGVATIMGGVNYVTTVIRLRAPGMTYMRMPLTVWGPLAHRDPERPLRPGARLGGAAPAPRPLFGTQFFVAGAAR